MSNDYPGLTVSEEDSLEKTGLPCRRKTVTSDVVVVGGGTAGICAAVASARNGAKTLLIQDRPVLGGNASSEIRVCICGAKSQVDGKGGDERETGIIEEILLENYVHNPQDSYTVWDHVLYDFVTREPNLALMLNTQAVNAVMDGSRIASAICWQATTETEVTVNAQLFIDCSGDGFLAAAAGAPYRTGREAAAEFDETYAPEEADGWQMGASLLLTTRDMGRPMPYRPPSFAAKVDKEYLKRRHIGQLREGFWWIEIGHDDDIVAAQETNRELLMAYLHGVWDYIKNSGDFPEAENLVLDWVGSVPGRRESRRFIGDYILSERDLTERRLFDDAVAFGGWPIDEHCPGGILSPDLPPTWFHQHFAKVYQIPFRSLYSRTIDNLMFSGRNISQTHIALASTRVMSTGAAMGQATGTAAALCLKHDTTPRGLGQSHIRDLQQQLLRDDAYIPLCPATGDGDLARQATLSASSTASGDVSLLVDGVPRDEDGDCHHWESDGLPAQLTLTWDEPVALSEVVLKLDTDVRTRLWKKMKAKAAGSQVVDPIPPRLVKRLSVEVLKDRTWTAVATRDDIIRRLVEIQFDTMQVSAVRITFHETYGHPNATLFEVRCYVDQANLDRRVMSFMSQSQPGAEPTPEEIAEATGK